jgi:hypothetical protein
MLRDYTLTEEFQLTFRQQKFFMNLPLGCLLALLSLFCTPRIHSAPAPLTSSSQVISLLKGIYRSQTGFILNARGTDWVADAQNGETANLELIYRAPDESKGNVQAALTVRVDNLIQATSLRAYVNKWIADYPKFGMDVLGSKAFRHKSDWGYVIDIKAPQQKKQLRQVVFVREKTAVILSCRDDEATFRESLKSCNHIFRSFQWTL